MVGLLLQVEGARLLVELAVELAGDVDKLARERRGLREQMRASELMDEEGFARKVEQAYAMMFDAWEKGRRK